MFDFHGSNFVGMPGLRVSMNPFGGPNAMPSAEDLPGAARVAEEAAPRDMPGPKRPRTGLLPMRVARMYAITVTRPQIPREEARSKLALTQRALRAAMQREAEARRAVTDIAPSGSIAPDLVSAYTRAANERAALSELYATTARAAGRDPHEIVCCLAQDPTLCGEAFADPSHPPVWICTHERCKGQRWADPQSMIADHDPKELARKAEAHVYGLWSDVPIDPEAPVVGVLGLIAPTSADGTPVMRIAAAFAEELEEDESRIAAPDDINHVVEEATARRGRKARSTEAGT